MKRKVSGFEDFCFGKDEAEVVIPLMDDRGNVSVGIRTGTGTEKVVNKIELTPEEAVKVMAEWWEFLVSNGMNVAAMVQEYRRLWKEKNTHVYHSRVHVEGPRNPFVEDVEPVVVKMKSVPIKFQVSEGIENVFPGEIRRGSDEVGEAKTLPPFPEKVCATADEWNMKFPVGTKVIYYPVKDIQDGAFESKTRSEAWTLGHGEPVVKIEGKTGGVILSHLRVIE
jgi:hypothetical protein